MFETWIASDLEAPADARRARVLNVLALWFLLGLAGLIIVALTTTQEEDVAVDERLMLTVGGMGLGLALSYALSRRGTWRAAVGTFELVLNVALLAALGALGSLSPALAFVPLAVLSTAILWSRRAAVWLALAWSVAYLVTALAEQGDFEPLLLRGRPVLPAAVSIWLVLLGFGLSSVLAWMWVAGAPRGPVATPGDRGQAAPEAQALAQPQETARPSEGQAEEPQPEVAPPDPQRQSHPALPVLPLFRGTIALPVSGEFDAALGERLLSELFRGIVEHDAQFVLLDLSHVPIIHPAAARSLARAVAGADLMGAEVALVGIAPRLAAQLVELDVSLQDATTHVDMEAALRYALQRLGHISRPLLKAGPPIAPSPRQLQSGSTTES
jgi:anti-anti-sigma regulatory factor